MKALLTTALIVALTGGSTPAGADRGALLIVNRLSEKCLTVGVGDNSTVTQWTCSTGDRFQRWELVGGDHFKLRNKATAHCLTVTDPTGGTPVRALPCDTRGHNRWRLSGTTGHWRELHLSTTRACLDVYAGSRSDGAVIQQQPCTPDRNDNQTWLLI